MANFIFGIMVAHVGIIDGSATACSRWGQPALGRGTLCGGPVSRRSLPEWVLGQGFFDTEAAGGPLRATEKTAPSSDETPRAILQMRRMDVEQPSDRKTAHTQIGLHLHVVDRQQCRNHFIPGQRSLPEKYLLEPEH